MQTNINNPPTAATLIGLARDIAVLKVRVQQMNLDRLQVSALLEAREICVTFDVECIDMNRRLTELTKRDHAEQRLWVAESLEISTNASTQIANLELELVEVTAMEARVRL